MSVELQIPNVLCAGYHVEGDYLLRNVPPAKASFWDQQRGDIRILPFAYGDSQMQ